jgi:threonine dehydratase
MIPQEWIQQARLRIAPHILNTPLTKDDELDLIIKWENLQVTGSFKARGALNKILSLQNWECAQGLVAASAGNHGQGVALAGKIVGAPVIIFASEHAVPQKIHAMQALGANVILVPGGYGEAEIAGMAYAQQHQATWISPYNDGQVIAGQGTLALEVLPELSDARAYTWVVPVGGGGLISGIGTALSALMPSHRLIGVQSEASAFMHGLFTHGSQDGLQDLPTLADGLSGPVEAGAVTIPLVRRYADQIILVSESEISGAISQTWRRYHQRIEGSAAVCLAAIFSGKISVHPAVVIITGGNIDETLHKRLCQA